MMHEQKSLPFPDGEQDGGSQRAGSAKERRVPAEEDSPPPNPYEEKLERRKARLEAASARASARSDAAFDSSRAAIEHIPFGQPILRGHHSERRHRRDLERSHRAMDRAVAESKRAKELERAASRVGTAGISSDDPDALSKLAARVESLEAQREGMKRANREYRAGGWDAVTALSDSARERIRAAAAASPGLVDVPFPAYALKNLGGNIRRLKKRMEALQAAADEEEASPVRCAGFSIEECKAENRVRLVFDAKPNASTRTLLKENGFRWAPSVGAWQRQLNAAGRRAAEQIRLALSPGEETSSSPEQASTSSWVRDHDRNEVIVRIRKGLNDRSTRKWSVTGGRGTSYGWIHIDAPPARRTFTHRATGETRSDGLPIYELTDVGKSGDVMGPDDRVELARLLGYGGASDVPHQGVKVPSGHDYYAEFIDRAEGREPSTHGVPYWD